MMPVFLLTDGYLANGSEPWQIPKIDDYDKQFIDVPLVKIAYGRSGDKGNKANICAACPDEQQIAPIPPSIVAILS